MTSVILTSNKYRHLLENFSTLYHRFFNVPGTTVISCFKKPEQHNFTDYKIVSFGEDNKPWAWQLRETLKQIDDEIILVWHEDFYLRAPFDYSRFKQAVSLMLGDRTIKRFSLQSVKDGYENCAKPISDGIYQLNGDAQYLCSVELSLWRKSFLMEMIDEKDDHHAIEIEMSKRAKGAKVLVFEKPVAVYSDAMRNGEPRIKFEGNKMFVLVPGDYWQDTGVSL